MKENNNVWLLASQWKKKRNFDKDIIFLEFIL